jgi:hypothetical protein
VDCLSISLTLGLRPPPLEFVVVARAIGLLVTSSAGNPFGTLIRFRAESWDSEEMLQIYSSSSIQVNVLLPHPHQRPQSNKRSTRRRSSFLK